MQMMRPQILRELTLLVIEREAAMGDAVGARTLLEEVLRDGSQVQKDVAQRMLDGGGA